MSLENELKKNTAALVALTEALGQSSGAATTAAPVAPPVTVVEAPVAPPVTVVEAPVAPPVTVVEAPVATSAPIPTAPVAMPGFTPPAPVASAPVPLGKAPFNDAVTMVNYVSGVYQEIGATHGEALQAVMIDLKVTNINDVAADQYDALYAAIEAVKAQANG